MKFICTSSVDSSILLTMSFWAWLSRMLASVLTEWSIYLTQGKRHNWLNPFSESLFLEFSVVHSVKKASSNTTLRKCNTLLRLKRWKNAQRISTESNPKWRITIVELFGRMQTMRHKIKRNACYKYKKRKFTEIIVNFCQESWKSDVLHYHLTFLSLYF